MGHFSLPGWVRRGEYGHSSLPGWVEEGLSPLYASFSPLFVGSPPRCPAGRPHCVAGTSGQYVAGNDTFDRGVTGGWDGYSGPQERVKTRLLGENGRSTPCI